VDQDGHEGAGHRLDLGQRVEHSVGLPLPPSQCQQVTLLANLVLELLVVICHPAQPSSLLMHITLFAMSL
jgi:hypothetical protein